MAERDHREYHGVATSGFDDVRDDLAKFAESVNRQGDAVSRLLMAHNGELAKIWDEIAALRDAFLDDVRALSNRIEAVSKQLDREGDNIAASFALRSDVGDLRAEMLDRIAEATATPFDPPEDNRAA